MARIITFYQTDQGRKPVEDFLNALSPRQAQKVTWVMRLIEDLETVPSKFFRKMSGTDDIWEIRIEHESNIFRIFGFFDGPVFFVAGHAIQKKSAKTPSKEILLIEERKRLYFRRKKNERS